MEKENLRISNLVFIWSMVLFSLAFLAMDWIDDTSGAFDGLESIKLTVAILASYAPAFIYNNYIGESPRLFKKSNMPKRYYFYFFVFIALINSISYFFSMGLENSFNNLGYTMMVSRVDRSPTDKVIMAFYVILLAPIIEELIYRGFILRKLKKHGLVFSVIISSMLFAFMHENIPQLIVGFLVGIVLGSVYAFTDSIKPAIVLHMLNNGYTTIYNSLIHENLSGHRNLEIYLIGEFVLLFIVSIYSATEIIKDIRQKDKHIKLHGDFGIYREYFSMKSSWLIIFYIIVSLAFSIRKI